MLNGERTGGFPRQKGFILAFLLLILSVFSVFGYGLLIGVVTGQSPDRPLYWRVLANPAITAQDDQFFEHREVPAGTPLPWRAGQALDSSALEDIIQRARPQGLTGLLIVQNGQVVFERYFGGRDVNTLYPSFSMSKSVVGLLTGIAWQEGKIHSLDDPASLYVPELRGLPQGRITVRQLLSMRTGLETEQVGQSLWRTITSAEVRAYFGPDLLDAVRRTPVVGEPGVTWAYSNAGVALLGLVVSRATGENLSAYFSQKLWQPLGAEQAALWSLDRAGGQEKGFAGISATARDYARLGQLVLQNGQWEGQQLVPADYLRLSLTPQQEVEQQGGTPTLQYGYLFWLYPPVSLNGQVVTAHQMLNFEGFMGQIIGVVPDLHSVVVVFNDADTTDKVSVQVEKAIVNGVLK